MATITAIANYTASHALNVLDPATWVGGVVPGPGDKAVFPKLTLSRIRKTGLGYIPWEGTSSVAAGAINENQFGTNANYAGIYLTDIQAGGLYEHPGCDYNTSGSIYVGTSGLNYGGYNQFVKINFTGSYLSSNDYFLTCSVDNSFRPWLTTQLWTGSRCQEDTDAIGSDYVCGGIWYNAPVLPATADGGMGYNRYELTGSGVWEVGSVIYDDWVQFEIKDQAELKLVYGAGGQGSYGTNIDMRLNTPWGAILRVLDEAKITCSGSSDRHTTGAYDGIYVYNQSGISVEINGTPNYSSSILSQSVSANDHEIVISDSSSFGIGDIVTIQSTSSIGGYAGKFSSMTYDLQSKPSGSSNYNYKYGVNNNPSRDTIDSNTSFISSSDTRIDGVVQTAFAPQQTYQGKHLIDVKDDEVVRIVSMSGHTAFVNKLHGLEGVVWESLPTASYKEFVETYDIPVDYFSGNKRPILIESLHKDYKKGDKLIINNKSYTIHDIGVYQSRSAFVDFKGGDGFDKLVTPEYYMAGWRYGRNTSNTHYYPFQTRWNTYYAPNPQPSASYLLTSSAQLTAAAPGAWRTGSRGSNNDQSFHLDSGSFTSAFNGSFYANYMSDTFQLKDTTFHWGEIIISGSLIKDLTGAYENNSSIGLGYAGLSPRPDWYYEGVVSGLNYNSAVPRNQKWVGMNGKYWFKTGPREAYNNVIDLGNTYTFTSSLNPPAAHTGSGESFHLRVETEWETGREEVYYGNSTGEYKMYEGLWEIMTPSPIRFNIKRYGSIFSIEVKNKYQIAILDTTDDFDKLDRIQEGGILYSHDSGKVMKWFGTEIEDAYGYQNLSSKWYRQWGSGSLNPYVHSYNRTNTYGSYNSASVNVDTGIQYMGCYYNADEMFYHHEGIIKRDWGYPNSGRSFTVVDLGESIEFDAIGIIPDTGEENTVTNTMTDVKIEVSDDPFENNWTVVRASEDDTRLSTGHAGIRYYSFASGSVTKRFIKYSNTETTYSDIGFFGVYKGQTGSTALKLKLKNADNFKVGDWIMFWNLRSGGPTFINRSFYNAQNYPIDTPDVSGMSTTGTADTAFPWGSAVQITAISGQEITLDRDPAYHQINEDTIVLKVNRGGVQLVADSPRNQANMYLSYAQAGSENVVKNASCLGGGLQCFSNYSTGYTDTPRIWVEDFGQFRYYGAYHGAYLRGNFFVRNLVLGEPGQFYAGNYTTPPSTRIFNIFCTNQYTTYTFQMYDDGSTGDYQVNFMTSLCGHQTQGGLMINPNARVRMMSGLLHYKNNYIISRYYEPIAGRPDSFIKSNQYIMENNTTEARYSGLYTSTSPYQFMSGGDRQQHGHGHKPWQRQSYFIPGRYQYNYNAYNNVGNLGADGDKNAQFIQSKQINNQPCILIGNYLDKFQIQQDKNKEYFQVFNSDSTLNNTTGQKVANIFYVRFYTKKDMNVTINMSFDIRVNKWRANWMSDNITSVNGTSAYDRPGQNKIHAMLIDHNNMDNILYLESLNNNSENFTTRTINKTLTAKAFNRYTFQIHNNAGSQIMAQGLHAMDYKNMSMNLFTEENDLNDLIVIDNTFMVHKMFTEGPQPDSQILPLTLPGNQNYGPIPTARIANDTGSIINLNNVKL